MKVTIEKKMMKIMNKNHRTNPYTPAQFPVHVKYRASPDGLRVAVVVKLAQKSTPFVCGRGGGAIAR